MLSGFRVLALLLALGGIVGAGGAARANAVTEWNARATEVLGRTPWQPGRAPYALAMVQLAVFDAVDAIHPRYLPYRSGVRAPAGASDIAAIATAARRVLRSVAPDQSVDIDASYESALAGIEPKSRSLGQAVGEAAAAAIIAQRRAQGAYFGAPGPDGIFGPSPKEPTDEAPLPLLDIDRGAPFVLTDVDQFLPPPPAPVESTQYKRDLAETLRIGFAESIVRTPEQSRIAQFHVLAGVSAWSEIARLAISARKLDLVDSARALALVDAALADGLAAGSSAKLTYRFVRPDKVAAANGMPWWRPFIGMPPTWEYPCQHCANGTAGQAALEAVFGDNPFAFTITSDFSHETRHFRSFRHYAEEEAISRIYGGVHYRWSEVAGEALGREVAQYIAAHAMTPIGARTPD